VASQPGEKGLRNVSVRYIKNSARGRGFLGREMPTIVVGTSYTRAESRDDKF